MNDLEVLFEVLIVNIGEIDPEVYAPAFITLLSRLGHKLTDSKHVLTFPALRGIKDFVHYISLPEADNFLGLH